MRGKGEGTVLGLLAENERKGRGLPRFGFCKRGGYPLLLAAEGKKKVKPAGREERKMMSSLVCLWPGKGGKERRWF